MTIRPYDFDVAVETSEQPGSTTPTDPDDLITKEYADSHYLPGGASVADTTALAAIDAAERFTGKAVVVESTKTLYIFDAASADTADGTRIVQPSSGSGRWFRSRAGETHTTGDLSVDRDLTVTRNAIITGDLTVNGTTTTINTATMDVEDPNITVNKGGNQATANSNKAGIKVEMSDATHVFFGYDSTLASRFKAGDSGSESEVIIAAQAQTFTGIKTFNAPFAVQEVSTPATPAAGFQKIYPKTDGKWYTLDDAGIETMVGSGAGGGGIEYIDNPDAETDTSGYSLYDDAAAVPVDGTGGTVSITWTRNTTTPLRGGADFKFTKDAANRQGEGVAYAFTIDRADKSKRMKVSMDVGALAASNYVDDDVKIYILDVTNATIISPSTLGIKKADYKYEAYFNTTTSTSYMLLIHTATTNASAYDLYFDNLSVSPTISTLGTPKREWTSYTSTVANNGSKTFTVTAQYAQDGSDMLVWIFADGVTTASGSSATTNLTFSLPSGFTAYQARIPGTISSVDAVVGNAQIGGVTSSTAVDDTSCFMESTTSIAFVMPGGARRGVRTSDLNAANDMNFNIIARIPITEWQGANAFLNQAVPEYVSNNTSANTNSDNTTNFVHGPDGSPFPGTLTGNYKRRVRFLTPIQPTDQLLLQAQESGTGTWTPIESMGAGFKVISSTQTGARILKVAGSDTDVDVQFSRYSADTSNWGTSEKWRVVKIPGMVGASMGIVSGTFTPSLSAASGGIFSGQGSRVGLYTKIGNTVFFTISIVAGGSLGSGTGTLSLVGLPFTSKNTTNGYYTYALSQDNWDLAETDGELIALFPPNSTEMTFYSNKDAAGSASISSTAVASRNVNLTMTGFYFTDT